MKRFLLLTCVSLLASGCISPPHHARTSRPAVSPAPMHNLEVVDMDGRRHDVSQLLESGQTVALVFWQTWCASCLKEAPALRKAALENRGRVQFFGVISGENEYVDDAKVRDLVERFGMPYPQVRDRDMVLTRRFAVEGTPTIVVLNKHGVVSKGHRVPERWK